MSIQVPDAAARERIESDLEANLLVEAGAGSGKTTALVGRMLAHVRAGTRVEHLAAVTFTRKAANELRERFQVRLEEAWRAATPGSAEADRLALALHELDRAFLGTIHAFCARLLRERPIDAGLGPLFEEVSDEDWDGLCRDFWRRWVERAIADGEPLLDTLSAVHLEPGQLQEAFRQVVDNADVAFPSTPVPMPEVDSARRELMALMDGTASLMPSQAPSDGWDRLMETVRTLQFHLAAGTLADDAGFCAVAETLSKAGVTPTQKRWAEALDGEPAAAKARKAEIKQLGEAWERLVSGPLAAITKAWHEHRYGVVQPIIQRAARAFAQERLATGRLGFNDLLQQTARLLRTNDVVRAELGHRYRHLFVDEFQDTDPVQADVCFLLASDPATGRVWQAVQPRPGSLFVVGDPKQSIYRFRRADIQVYDAVKARFSAWDGVVALTTTFRSTPEIAAFVNAQFAADFAVAAVGTQAPFRAMEALPQDDVRIGGLASGVYTYDVFGTKKGDLAEMDQAIVATWVATEVRAGRLAPGDVMILTHRKEFIAAYAQALAAYDIPVRTAGASLPRVRELSELLVVLRALADPGDAVATVAALEGMFLGCTPGDLWRAREAGMALQWTVPPAQADGPVARGLRQLHDWWQLSRRMPADVLLERLLDDTGVLALAASAPLGETRAGALLHLVQSVREVAITQDASLSTVIERLASLLAQEAPDTPLRPDARGAVQIMNVHKAKGLEAKVVILAAPVEFKPQAPSLHVRRTADGQAVGGVVLQERVGPGTRALAAPHEWQDQRQAEAQFAAAERTRLLYVAVTRAARVLVVGRGFKATKKDLLRVASAWSPLDDALTRIASPLPVPAELPAAARATLAVPVETLRSRMAAAQAAVRTAAERSQRLQTVTATVKPPATEHGDRRQPRRGGLGAGWGRAVHRGIEAMGRGRTGSALARLLAAVARDEMLTPEQTTALPHVIERVAASPAWQRLTSAGTLALELPVMRVHAADGVQQVLDGVIDAATFGPEGWQVVDWKTDDVDDAAWAVRAAQYQRQVETYAELLAALTGAPVSAQVERVRA